MPGVTLGEDIAAVLRLDPLADLLRRAQDGAMRYSTLEGRTQGNHRGDVSRSLVRNRACNNSTQAVPDHVNFSACFLACLVNCFFQTPLDEEIRTLGIDPDSGEIRPIADASEPGIEFQQVNISTEKAGNDHYTRVIS